MAAPPPSQAFVGPPAPQAPVIEDASWSQSAAPSSGGGGFDFGAIAPILGAAMPLLSMGGKKRTARPVQIQRRSLPQGGGQTDWTLYAVLGIGGLVFAGFAATALFSGKSDGDE